MKYKIRHFIEIVEDLPKLNRSIKISAIKIIVRVLTKFLSFANVSIVLDQIKKFIFIIKYVYPTNQEQVSYFEYILNMNKMYFSHLSYFKKNDLSNAAYIKSRLVRYKSKYSINRVTRYSAKIYDQLISNNNFFERLKSKNFTSLKIYNSVVNQKENIFYLYGPNAENLPDIKYKDFCLVNSKPIKTDIGEFKKKILFINSDFYRNKLQNAKEERIKLLKTYDKIFLSCKSSVIPAEFCKSKFITFDGSFSGFMLANIIYNLKRQYSDLVLIIEGFDGYTKKTIFNKIYPSLATENDNTEKEIIFCRSLIEHDAYFNFILLRILIKNITIIDSEDFKTFVSMSPEEYLKRLQNVRRFNLIK
ncbi:hypothetical protein [Acinetobacter sp.]|uniref:hypothetical protein n=1 Tax=Acinetobacter sp. TaxID=472 RepID=UPI000C4BF32E|nr:hypothetical protein [Acinetobacter sp.]MBC70003.1 hypothetical protein [Acinetobacter sp.]|tara:strand:- start:673 stop:1755 length:1083 start_codon:yes stop_codon:yes gene_type:complete